MNYFKSNYLFFGSIFLGLFIWLFAYAFLPVNPTEEIKTGTIVFIVANYLALIIGFSLFKFKTKHPVEVNLKNLNKFLTLLLVVIFVCYLLRWYDLFSIRDLSFNKSLKENRILNDYNYHKSNLILLFASVIKSAYFFPFVIAVSLKQKPKKIVLVFAYIALMLPFLEAALKGTRKPFFEIFIIILFSIILFKKRKINLKKIGIAIASFVLLLFISMSMLFKRESKNLGNDYFYSQLLESRYNDMLSPKEGVKDYFYDKNNPEYLKFIGITALHIGQYLTHGAFEFNHIYNKKNLSIANGSYTFVAVPKLINKTGLVKKIEYPNPSPREYVYLTAFGGFYIDFRWFSVALMFLFGVFQKYVFNKSEQFIIWRPLTIFFLIINVFLLIINYLRGGGIYPIASLFLFFIFLKISGLNLYEKSTSA